ncbi:spore coat protein U domain-containing protein [Pseudopontixanthobacter vadosimaris]|uniref:spore coat protein U domain-containing protein n=1 Tax=Pseudopontixanthobacter vadosimaris TaxID=2726450 RepID=UPI001475C831|nr:spore coat protein U domain-containing protein [Pseudopontixanthobacter vadosimaris]
MKKIVLCAVASTAFISTSAFAQSNTTTDTFVVTANVTPTCVMENVQDIDLGALKIVTTAGSNALVFGNGSKSATSNAAYLSCNDTNAMTITSDGALKNARGVTADESADGFSDRVDFRVYANNYGAATGNARQTYFSRNGGSQRNADPRGALHRQISFQGSVDYDDNRGFRPIAGAYSSTVTVTVAIAS